MNRKKKADNRSFPENSEAYPIRIKPFAWAVGVMWSLFVAASLMWNLNQTRQGIDV